MRLAAPDGSAHYSAVGWSYWDLRSPQKRRSASSCRVDLAHSHRSHFAPMAEIPQCSLSPVGLFLIAGQHLPDHRGDSRLSYLRIGSPSRTGSPCLAENDLVLVNRAAAAAAAVAACCLAQWVSVAAVVAAQGYAGQPFDSHLPILPDPGFDNVFALLQIEMGIPYKMKTNSLDLLEAYSSMRSGLSLRLTHDMSSGVAGWDPPIVCAKLLELVPSCLPCKLGSPGAPFVVFAPPNAQVLLLPSRRKLRKLSTKDTGFFRSFCKHTKLTAL